MKKLYILFLLCSFIGFSQSPGDIVITEIMKDPGLVSDNFGEWFEVYNTTGSPIDMNGWIIRDQPGTGQNLVTITGSVIVPAGGYITLGRGGVTDPGDPSYNGGITHAYVYDSSFLMANGDDEVILEVSGVIIDEVYFTDAAFPDTTGASMQLDPGSLTSAANDTGSNWCVSTTAYGGGDLGTPGAANANCAPVCETTLGASDTTCTTTTVGPTSDTYSVTLAYSGAATGEVFVVSTSPSGFTIGGDNPTTIASGTITVSGVTEGTDITITVDNTGDGGLCNLSRAITSPLCEPTGSVDLQLRGIIDFGLASNDGKAIHLVATADIADLSEYGLGSANNGGGTDGEEYTFPASSVSNGDNILIVRNAAAMEAYLTTPGYNLFNLVIVVGGTPADGNGNDAVELFKFGVVVETYGDINDGVAASWFTADSWAYKTTLGSVWPAGWIYGSPSGCANNTTTFLSDCVYPFVAPLSTEEFNSSEFSIYPNPVTNGLLTIGSQIEGEKSIELFDVTGRSVMQTRLNSDVLNVSSLQSGLYLLRVSINGRNTTAKIVIK